MATKRGFYGWKLVGALSAMDFLNLGFPFYIGAVINPYMLQHIPMSRSTFALCLVFRSHAARFQLRRGSPDSSSARWNLPYAEV